MSPHHHASVRDLWAGVRYDNVGAALSRSSSSTATTQILEEEEEAVEKTVLSGQLLGCKCTAEEERRGGTSTFQFITPNRTPAVRLYNQSLPPPPPPTPTALISRDAKLTQ